MLVKIVTHLDVLLAVLIWGGNAGKMSESQLIFIVVISTAVTYTANSYSIGFLRAAPVTRQ